MPIKDVRCNSCNTVTEYFLRNNEEPTKCKQCNSEDIVILIGAPSLRFIGEGFYINDSCRGGDKRERLTDQNRKLIYGDE